MDELRRICSRHGIEDVIEASLLTGGFANRNYKVKTRRGNFFYRVCTRQEDIKNIIYEVDILLELKKIHFPTAYLIPEKNGSSRISAMLFQGLIIKLCMP